MSTTPERNPQALGHAIAAGALTLVLAGTLRVLARESATHETVAPMVKALQERKQTIEGLREALRSEETP